MNNLVMNRDGIVAKDENSTSMLQGYVNARIVNAANNHLIPPCFKNENVKLSLG